MTQRLQNKRALVTAAGNGIGLASAPMARRRAGLGHRHQPGRARPAGAAGTGRGPGQAARARAECCWTRRGASLRPEIGALDALFNCAGRHAGNILECPESDWDFATDLNAKSMHRTIRAFLPAMLERGGGSIINMSRPPPASRRAQPLRLRRVRRRRDRLMTKAVAADFVARGIRCNAICPGTIESPSLRDASPRRRARPAPTTRPCAPPSWPASPSARRPAPKVAALAVYCLDESAFTTGTIQVIDGGWSTSAPFYETSRTRLPAPFSYLSLP